MWKTLESSWCTEIRVPDQNNSLRTLSYLSCRMERSSRQRWGISSAFAVYSDWILFFGSIYTDNIAFIYQKIDKNFVTYYKSVPGIHEDEKDSVGNFHCSADLVMYPDHVPLLWIEVQGHEVGPGDPWARDLPGWEMCRHCQRSYALYSRTRLSHHRKNRIPEKT